MKAINWKVRINNKLFWIAVIPAVLILIQTACGLFGLSLDFSGLEEKLMPDWNNLCAKHEYITFVTFDMDRLKYINDTYGHQAGDYAIRLTANAIRRAAPKDAILARVGGDEFLAVLPRANRQAAEQYIKDFQKELKQLNKQENRAFDVEASCAAVVYKLDSFSTIEECVQKSDEAMYLVKEKHHRHRKD